MPYRRRRTSLAVAAALLALAWAALPAAALPVTAAGAAEQISSLSPFANVEPAVVTTPEGGYLTVWTDLRHGVKARFVDAGGAPMGAEILVAANDPLPEAAGYYDYVVENAATVTPLEDGAGYLVVWLEEKGHLSYSYFRYQFAHTSRRVFARVLGPTGAPVGDAFAVGRRGHLQSRPAAQRLADGRVVAVWEEHTELDRSLLFARFVNADGQLAGEAFQLLDGSTFNPAGVEIAAAPDGGFLLVWTASDGQDTGVVARRFDAAGQTLGPTRVVNTVRPRGQGMARVAPATEGGFVVLFQSTLVPHEEVRIYSRRLNAAGVPQGPQHEVSVPELSDADAAPGLATLPGGGFLALWIGWIDDFPQWVLGRELNASGQPVGNVVQVSGQRPRSQHYVAAAGTADGLFVAWEGFDGSDGTAKAVTGRAYQGGGVQALTLELSAGDR